MSSSLLNTLHLTYKGTADGPLNSQSLLWPDPRNYYCSVLEQGTIWGTLLYFPPGLCFWRFPGRLGAIVSFSYFRIPHLPRHPCRNCVVDSLYSWQMSTLLISPYTTHRLKGQGNTRKAPSPGPCPAADFGLIQAARHAFSRAHLEAAATSRPPAPGPDQRIFVPKQHP